MLLRDTRLEMRRLPMRLSTRLPAWLLAFDFCAPRMTFETSASASCCSTGVSVTSVGASAGALYLAAVAASHPSRSEAGHAGTACASSACAVAGVLRTSSASKLASSAAAASASASSSRRAGTSLARSKGISRQARARRASSTCNPLCSSVRTKCALMHSGIVTAGSS
eukprot:scaffold85272_cov72-Phaeocystis_antarctica.AAC.5